MTEEDKQFIKDNYLTMLDREMAEALGYSRTYISSWCRQLGLKRPQEVVAKRKAHSFTEERRKKYSEMAKTNENLIKNRFKPGHNIKSVAVGTIVQDNRDGYLKIKVSDDKNLGRKNWKYLHRLVWENAYGAIPEGQRLVFLDGDKNNLSLDNLELVDNKIIGTINRHYKFSNNPEETKSYIELAKLKLAIGDVKRKRDKKDGR